MVHSCLVVLFDLKFQVCGLKWSPDGRYLASGGNDNLLNIWTGIPGQATFQTQPIHSLR